MKDIELHFEKTRLKILELACLYPDKIDPAYAYAWQARVFPLGYEEGLHIPLESGFSLAHKNNMVEIKKAFGFYIRDEWLNDDFKPHFLRILRYFHLRFLQKKEMFRLDMFPSLYDEDKDAVTAPYTVSFM